MDEDRYATSSASRSSDEDITQALLPDSKIEDATTTVARRHGRGNIIRFVTLQFFLISIYTTIFLALRSGDRDHLVYSPAASALKFEKIRYNATLVIESAYNGPPSPEVDAAWTALLDNMNIAVPKSDLDKIGSTSIRIPNTSTYFAGLGVFHELHCLKRLRQYTWKEHYFPNITPNDERLNRLHTDHCLEILRQAIMCRADISLFTLQWSEDNLHPRADFSQEHECVDFQAVFEWAGKRRVDAGAPGLLVHPKFGVAYPNGTSSKIGGSEDVSATIVED
ncbi:hypothetical protein B0T14DRAFT_556935 [Immersiella caudata]|uniref:Tat pathway signal sequence n=1 Tax=Immersiella caudata TaxID=314043 RepID=A0AA39WDA3_9PEZI|nr:hypothetical protein B0T14DRAFT_556935 [Immersiella caudata]